MNTLTTTLAIRSSTRWVVTPAQEARGYIHLLQAMRNEIEVMAMTRLQLAEYLIDLAATQPAWTKHYEVFTAIAKELAPQLFEDKDDDAANPEELGDREGAARA